MLSVNMNHCNSILKMASWLISVFNGIYQFVFQEYIFILERRLAI